MIVAFQWEPGAYSQEAIAGYFGPVETLPCESFETVFSMVASARSEAGLIPIENSLAGSSFHDFHHLIFHPLLQVVRTGLDYLAINPSADLT
jgi:prephenate dehydratase